MADLEVFEDGNAGKYYVLDRWQHRHIVFKSWCTRAYL